MLEGFPAGAGLNAAGQDVDFNFVRALNMMQTDSPSTQELADLLGEMLASRQTANEEPRRDQEAFHSMYA